MFLEFASKIGVISVLPFQDTGSMYASYYSQGITVPYGVNTRGLPGQRHIVYVVPGQEWDYKSERVNL
jgi:hypothetical protein